MSLLRRRAALTLLAGACWLAATDPAPAASPVTQLAQNSATQPAAPTVDAKTLEKYGLALALGNRASQFAGEIAVIRDAVARGDRAAAGAGIQALYAKAKRPVPEGSALDQLLGQLPPPDAPPKSASGLGPTKPLGGSPSSPSDPYAGNVGGGPTLPLGASPSSPNPSGATGLGPTNPLGGLSGSPNPYTGGAGLGPTNPLGGSPDSPNPYTGGTGLGPTNPLGGSPASPSPGTSGAGSSPTNASGGSPGSSTPSTSPFVPPPALNAPLSADAPACGFTPPSAGAGPISIEQLLGLWTDSGTGEQVEFTRDTITGRPDRIVLRSKHTWRRVTFQGQRLTLCRAPEVEEMAEAPDWAKQQAYGKIKWELELDAKDESGQLVLEGKWYPGSYKWSEDTGLDPSAPPKRTVSDFGRGTPIDKKYIKPPPAISGVIVLTDQTAFVQAEQPKWPYSAAAGDTRILFIYGRGLPRSWSDNIDFKSEDPNLTYFAVALEQEPNLAPLRKQQIEAGWREARKDLDADTTKITKDLTAVLAYARTKSGVLPGSKQFKLNGLDASWRLRFGDDRAAISFMRSINEGLADPTGSLVLPERVFLEVRTGAAFPIESIPLKVQVNKTPVTWNGAQTIAARRVEPTVYRTDTIEFLEAGTPMPAAERGIFFLPAHVKDEVDVRLEDPFLFGLTPASLVTKILRTPAELGDTWKEALTKAARADGFEDFSDWSQLPGSKATEISNYIVTPIILKTLESATPLYFLRYVPKVYQFIKEAERGSLHSTTPVTVGEHAALILFRDQFIKSMTAAMKNFDQIKGEVALRGLREAVKASAWDENSPWRYLRVSCPGLSLGSTRNLQGMGGDCSFPYVVSDTYVERTFGADKKAADAWVRQAVEEAIGNYRQAMQDAIAKAAGTADKDIPALLKLVGYSYQPLLPAVEARMMRLIEVGDPKRQLWIPEVNGRYQLRNLHTVVDAVQAQEDYSKLDTQMAMLMMAAVSAPFMLEEGLISAVIAWGTDATFLGVSLATDVPEFIEQHEEVHFALGASILLGTQRLQEAELRKTEWYQLLATVGQAAVGSVLSTVRMVGVVRTSLILRAVESGGLKAFETLSAGDKAAFWRFATEAKLLEEMGETKAITAMHRRASAAADDVFKTMKLNAGDIPQVKPRASIAAVGEPGPLPKTQTLQEPAEPFGSTIGFNKEGQPVKVNSGEMVPLDEADLAAGGKPREKSATVNYGAGSPGEIGVGDARAMQPPVEGGEFGVRNQQGQQVTIKLRAKLGEGGYAKAFVVVDSRIPGCAKGCAIKIYDPHMADLFFGVGKDQVNYIRQGAAELGDDVLQLKNLYYAPDAPQPYIIQELLGDTEDWMYFSKDAWPDHSAIAVEFRRRPELREATLDLFAKLRDKGLVWEDCHVRNIFFKRDGNRWVAGILDQDRIIKWTADRKALGNMGAWFGAAEAHYMPQHLKSLEAFQAKALFPDGVNAAGNRVPGLQIGLDEAVTYFREHPGPYMRDIDLFWEKSLERKGWLQFDFGEYQEGLLAPDRVEAKFPRLRDRERLGPYDPSIEFNKPKTGWLNNVLPFDRGIRLVELASLADLPLAA